MDLISVIIPVYNCEKYIKACCKSILNQTYPRLEIIIVNDGSYDQSKKIITSLAQKYKRIHVIDTCNNGVAAARNIGIDNAAGEYLCFVDADDLLPRKSIEMLYQKMKTDQSDFCQGSIKKICKVRNYLVVENKDITAEKEDYDSWRDVVGSLYWGPVASLYKTNIIKRDKIIYPESIKLGEDSIFLATYLQRCHKISTCSSTVYYYNQISSYSASRTGYEKTWEWLYLFTQKYSELYPDEYQNKKSAVEEIALRNMDFAFYHYILYCQRMGKEKILHYLQTIHDSLRDYLNELSTNNLIQPCSLELIEQYKSDLNAHAYENIYRRVIEKNTNRYEKNKSISITIKVFKRITSWLRMKIYFGL